MYKFLPLQWKINNNIVDTVKLKYKYLTNALLSMTKNTIIIRKVQVSENNCILFQYSYILHEMASILIHATLSAFGLHPSYH